MISLFQERNSNISFKGLVMSIPDGRGFVNNCQRKFREDCDCDKLRVVQSVNNCGLHIVDVNWVCKRTGSKETMGGNQRRGI